MVNLGWVKQGDWGGLLGEIEAVRAACADMSSRSSPRPAFSPRMRRSRCARVVSDSGADYIKTSTGFSSGGATREDVALLRRSVATHVKIKASGGIRTLADARIFCVWAPTGWVPRPS